jgi:hypothetical protein
MEHFNNSCRNSYTRNWWNTGVHCCSARWKINVEGTAAKPVVMTSGLTTKAAGDWGGLVICGKAPINHQRWSKELLNLKLLI